MRTLCLKTGLRGPFGGIPWRISMKRKKVAKQAEGIPSEQFFAELKAGILARETAAPVAPTSVDVKALSEEIARMIVNRIGSG
jgi:hypothetical protein